AGGAPASPSHPPLPAEFLPVPAVPATPAEPFPATAEAAAEGGALKLLAVTARAHRTKAPPLRRPVARRLVARLLVARGELFAVERAPQPAPGPEFSAVSSADLFPARAAIEPAAVAGGAKPRARPPPHAPLPPSARPLL